MAEQKMSMTTLLASNAVSNLGKTIGLTPSQVAKAKSTALTLSTNSVLCRCDKFSLIKAVFETAIYDFDRADCIYYVPYGNYVQAQVGFRGFKEVAFRTGAYKDINAREVLECDKITRDVNTGGVSIEFETDYNKTIGKKVVGYFAYALDKDGKVCNSVYWTREKCEAHGRQYSKAYSSIWGKDESSFSKMALKTVIKQLCGELKSSSQLETLVKHDQLVFGGQGQKDDYLDNATRQEFNDHQTNVNNTIEAEVKETKVEKVVVDNPVVVDKPTANNNQKTDSK